MQQRLTVKRFGWSEQRMERTWRFFYVLGYVLAVFLFRGVWRRAQKFMGTGQTGHSFRDRQGRRIDLGAKAATGVGSVKGRTRGRLRLKEKSGLSA
ncbi:MAG: hypothetical protein ACREJU_11230 [Nitrospiraceae bacterium]